MPLYFVTQNQIAFAMQYYQFPSSFNLKIQN